MTSTCFHGNAIISYRCLNHIVISYKYEISSPKHCVDVYTVLKKIAILKDIAISIPTSEITHVEQLFHLSVNMYTVLQLPDLDVECFYLGSKCIPPRLRLGMGKHTVC